MPTSDGTSATAQPGSLIILDKFGFEVANLSNAVVLNGPWDMTVNDQGSHAQLFISNVLSGTITRIDLQLTGADSISVQNVVQIASGYTHRSDPAALELGPTGLAYDPKSDTLYVTSTAEDSVFAVARAGRTVTNGGKGTSIFSDATRLHGPLGLVLAPNGDLIVANGDAINANPATPSELVEFTPKGQFVDQFSIDANTGGPFGLAVTMTHGQVRLAAVDDDVNLVTIWNLAKH
jgi:DNA-binding beta-propeller fold protein YncE